MVHILNVEDLKHQLETLWNPVAECAQDNFCGAQDNFCGTTNLPSRLGMHPSDMSEMGSALDLSVKTPVKILRETPLKYQSNDHINNLQEEKENFLKFGKVPRFKFAGAVDWLGMNKKKAEIRFDFFQEARYILERVRDVFGSGDVFLDAAFGERISLGQASQTVLQYLKSHGLDGSLSVFWTSDLNCSGKVLWQGPNVRYNRPEARKFTLWLKKSSENVYLREYGIKSLMDHEIGTHFVSFLCQYFIKLIWNESQIQQCQQIEIFTRCLCYIN